MNVNVKYVKFHKFMNFIWKRQKKQLRSLPTAVSRLSFQGATHGPDELELRRGEVERRGEHTYAYTRGVDRGGELHTSNTTADDGDDLWTQRVLTPNMGVRA